MECPHCHKEIEGKRCAACGTEVPVHARFCMQCGALLSQDEPTDAAMVDKDDGLDLENRILCPDGTCTGIIIEGRCSECGRPYSGQALK